MEEGRPSTIAMAAATAHAAHFLWDADPKILRDDLALAIMTWGVATTDELMLLQWILKSLGAS